MARRRRKQRHFNIGTASRKCAGKTKGKFRKCLKRLMRCSSKRKGKLCRR